MRAFVNFQDFYTTHEIKYTTAQIPNQPIRLIYGQLRHSKTNNKKPEKKPFSRQPSFSLRII